MGLIETIGANPPLPTEPGTRAETMRRLNVIAVIALADALLLAVLLWASIGDRESAVHVLGPIHGLGFVALLYLCVAGAVEQRWGWWYPLIVLVTGGPLGSLIGDWILRRRIAAG